MPAPPEMSVINQRTAAHHEVEPGAWCLDRLFSESCEAVDGPLTEVVATCDDSVVVALPEGFSPHPGDPLGDSPAEGGGAWPVDLREGTVLVQAEGTGRWNRASWTFELVRTDDGC